MILNESIIKSLPTRKSKYNVYDDRYTGFGVRIYPTGKVSYIYSFKLNQNKRVTKIGNFPVMSFGEALEKYIQASKLVASGAHPKFLEKSTISLREFSKRFYDDVLLRNRKRPNEAFRLLERNVLVSLGDTNIEMITTQMLYDTLNEVVLRGAPVVANRTAALVRQLFEYALITGVVEKNPYISTYKKYLGGKEASKERVLSYAEIKQLAGNVKQTTLNEDHFLSLMMILATAQRPGEVLSIKLDEICTDSKVWTIPSHKAKNGKEHQVPLNKVALSIVMKQASKAYHGQWLFPAIRNPSIPTCPRSVARALASNVSPVQRDGKASRRYQNRLKIAKFTPHDLRRTAATHMAELGVDEDVIGFILNHSRPGATPIYNRYRYLKEKREALELWGEKLSELYPD